MSSPKRVEQRRTSSYAVVLSCSLWMANEKIKLLWIEVIGETETSVNRILNVPAGPWISLSVKISCLSHFHRSCRFVHDYYLTDLMPSLRFNRFVAVDVNIIYSIEPPK